MKPLVYNYAVPITVKGRRAETTFRIFISSQPSAVVAREVAQGQLALLCSTVTPNLMASEFEVGEPEAVNPT